MKFYAGIGSRQTPQLVLDLMTLIACALRVQGYTLRSGHADGADLAFERGAKGAAEIFLPWAGFNSQHPVQGEALTEFVPEAYQIASEHHPAWAKLKQAVRKLMARNVQQVLGPIPGRNDVSQFVLCWTSDGKASGGTGQAIRVAEAHGVSVFNLHDPVVMRRLARMVSDTLLAQGVPQGHDAWSTLVEVDLLLADDEPEAHGCAGCADTACGFCRAATLARREALLDAADARVADVAAPKRHFEFWSGYTDPNVGVTLYG